MKLREFSDLIDQSICVILQSNFRGRCYAYIKNTEIIDDGGLKSTYGDGKTPEEAMKALVGEIRGKRIAVNAGGSNKQEFVVPIDLEY